MCLYETKPDVTSEMRKQIQASIRESKTCNTRDHEKMRYRHIVIHSISVIELRLLSEPAIYLRHPTFFGNKISKATFFFQSSFKTQMRPTF